MAKPMTSAGSRCVEEAEEAGVTFGGYFESHLTIEDRLLFPGGADEFVRLCEADYVRRLQKQMAM